MVKAVNSSCLLADAGFVAVQDNPASAGNGWVLNYYPAATKAYGGYTMLIRFHKEGTADVSCDL